MALGPKQMGEAILRNLKSKTGKSLEEWLEILAKSGHTDKKPAMNFLKKEHGVGHFQAQKIYEESINENMYENSDSFADDLFNTKGLSELYTQIKNTISAIADDVRVQPCKTYIPFYRTTQFAVVIPGKNNGVILGLNMPDAFTHAKFQKGKTPASERINVQTTINDLNDINEQVKSIIKEAYSAN